MTRPRLIVPAFAHTLTRRDLLKWSAAAIPLWNGCSRGPEAFNGYAFIANEEGRAIAALDLSVFTVARHIAIDGAPTQVVASLTQPVVYALGSDTGSVYEIATDTLKFTRKVFAASKPVSMAMAPDQQSLYVLAAEPGALIRFSVGDAAQAPKVAWRAKLPEIPVSFTIAPDGATAAVAGMGAVRLVDLAKGEVSQPLGTGSYGPVMFLSNGESVLAGDVGERRISVYHVGQRRLLTHLPIAVRPDNFCMSHDGGQLFVTGDGMDAVVVVYPYQSEVARTILAGRAPGVMAASEGLVFIASPQASDVSVLEIATHKVLAVVPVGTDPGCIVVTPDDEYVLILNRQSGDVTVLRVSGIQPNREKSAPLLTVIPVGSRPVSAALHQV